MSPPAEHAEQASLPSEESEDDIRTGRPPEGSQPPPAEQASLASEDDIGRPPEESITPGTGFDPRNFANSAHSTHVPEGYFQANTNQAYAAFGSPSDPRKYRESHERKQAHNAKTRSRIGRATG
jgi:hypothetical protein